MTTQAQIIAELTNLNSQDVWKGFSSKDKLFIAMMSVIAGSSGGGGGATGTSTEATQLEILTELQKRPIVQVVQNLVAGANIIVHNLNLLTPFVSTKVIVDNVTGTAIMASISSDSANSFTITSPIAYPNVRIVIRA